MFNTWRESDLPGLKFNWLIELPLYVFTEVEPKMTKFKLRKKWQKIIWGLQPNAMHIYRLDKNPAKLQKYPAKNCMRSCVRQIGHDLWWTAIQADAWGKQCVSRPLDPDWGRHKKFQKDPNEIVRGVAITGQPVFICYGRSWAKM